MCIYIYITYIFIKHIYIIVYITVYIYTVRWEILRVKNNIGGAVCLEITDDTEIKEMFFIG